MDITATMVKELREKSGAGPMECKKVLQETNGDMEKAIQILHKRGLDRSEKKIGREAKQGVIHAYIHHGHNLGVLVEVNCETDFVARNDDFKQLVKEIGIQIAGHNPRFIAMDQIPAETLEKAREEERKELEGSGKSPEIIEKIIEGKIKKTLGAQCLLSQPWGKDESVTIQDLIKQAISKIGENIVVRRFVRYELGGE